MDDRETLNRRARLRELIAICFEGRDASLLDHIQQRTGKRPNQGEMSGLQKDHGSRSFGDKKAKTLTEQIGLHRRWFDFGLGCNLAPSDWTSEEASPQPPDSSIYSRTVHPWPFPSIPEKEVRALSSSQLSGLEGALALAIGQLKLNVNVSPQELSRLDQARDVLKQVSEAANDEEYVGIRKIAVKVRAGVPGYSIDQSVEEFDGEIYVSQSWLRSRGLHADKLIATSVFGDSMEPRIKPDDLLLVNTADTARTPGKLFGVNHEGEFVVKRLQKRHNRWYLESDNPDQKAHPPVTCNEKTFIIGRVALMQSEDL